MSLREFRERKDLVSGVNAILNNLVFQPASNYYADFPITVEVCDGYHCHFNGINFNSRNTIEKTLRAK